MQSLQIVTLANGCFWCTEAVFKRLKGVISVQSGYSGGDVEHPSYEQVSSETTGHAESIQVTFDPSIISYETLLEVFFATHDPTTLNRQGNDTGPQYRSAIFYHDEAQKNSAEKMIQKLTDEQKFAEPIVTKVEAFKNFYPAEKYHKDYYDNNQLAPYCRVIIDPKIKKLIENFRNTVKDEYQEKN